MKEAGQGLVGPLVSLFNASPAQTTAGSGLMAESNH